MSRGRGATLRPREPRPAAEGSGLQSLHARVPSKPDPPPGPPPRRSQRRIGPGALTEAPQSAAAPYLGELRVPNGKPPDLARSDGRLVVASYNVHRWSGIRGTRFAPERAGAVIQELDADVLALQEVLRPYDADDPLLEVADLAGYHLAFVVTRRHRRGGELGNAILSRWPLQGAHVIDLSYGRLEQRAALAATFRTDEGPVTVASTHLALVDATRKQQVRALLGHPALAEGPAVLLGDMNAWRADPSARDLARVFSAHHNRAWPATYPSVAPVLALDRAYVRGARLAHIRAHDSPNARRASDHLPVVATLHLDA